MNFSIGLVPTLRQVVRHGGAAGLAWLMASAVATADDGGHHEPPKADGHAMAVDGANFALPADAKELAGYGPIKVSLLKAVPAPSSLSGAEAQAYSLRRSVTRASRNSADTPETWMTVDRAVFETKPPAFGEVPAGLVYLIEADFVAHAGQTTRLALHIDRLGGDKEVAYSAALVVAGTVIASAEGKVLEEGSSLTGSFQATGLADLPVLAVIATNASPRTEPLKISLTDGGPNPIAPTRESSAADRILPPPLPVHPEAHAAPAEGHGAAAGEHGGAKDKKKDKEKKKGDH